jgi:hypothetical protein
MSNGSSTGFISLQEAIEMTPATGKTKPLLLIRCIPAMIYFLFVTLLIKLRLRLCWPSQMYSDPSLLWNECRPPGKTHTCSS